jgi:mono/diheme cytochrome c family protein
MRLNGGRILKNEGRRTTSWRAPVGYALLVAVVAMPVMSAWKPANEVHASSRKERAKAATLFGEKGCEHCHGVEGAGTERGPSLSTVGKRLSRVQIEQQIKDGGKQMPAFGDVLSQDETKELVDYLVHMKKPAKGPKTT